VIYLCDGRMCQLLKSGGPFCML